VNKIEVGIENIMSSSSDEEVNENDVKKM